MSCRTIANGRTRRSSLVPWLAIDRKSGGRADRSAQIYGLNFGESDDNRRLDLEGHERVNIRLIIGISF